MRPPLTLAVLVSLVSASSAQVELFKLTASDGAAHDEFGSSVAVSGDLAIVGALWNDDLGSQSGSAYVFDVTTGQELFEITASDGDVDDRFGVSVAISGDKAVAGAYFDDDLGSKSGSAYVFGSAAAIVYCDSSQNPNNAAGISISTLDSSAPSISLTLSCGPPGQFCYLLVGDSNGIVSQPPGAKGDLCVVGGNCLGRYDKDVFAIDGTGGGTTDVQNAVSNPCNGGVNIVPGASWNWQFWHRQPMGQPATFSAALATTFY